MNNKTRLLDKNRKASKKLKILGVFCVEVCEIFANTIEKTIITVGKAIAISEIY